jgi:hypothetical protein
MNLTKEELKLCSNEHSYRAVRALFGSFAFIAGIMYPILIWSIVSTLWTCPPEKRLEWWAILKQLDWQGMAPGMLMFVVLFFLAYRAHTKLVLIRHLEYHQNKSRENEITANQQIQAIAAERGSA